MPNDNKLVTLEDLKEAIDAKAGVTGVKGDVESSYRTGNVNLTPANIGAVAKTGDTITGTLVLSNTTDASGTADNGPALVVGGTRTTAHLEMDGNEIIAKSDGTHGATLYLNYDGEGDVRIGPSGLTMTGPLTIRGDINQQSGIINGDSNNYTDHALQIGHYGLNEMNFYEYGGVFNFYRSYRGENILVFQINYHNASSAPLSVKNGGTGATTAAVTISTNYSSVLNVINALKGSRIFPISIQKEGGSFYSDMPSGHESHEWNLLLFGDSVRMTALLNIIGTSSLYLRNFFNGNWLTSWTQLY